jgi:aryl-phospho-beta-D-glucosidase BglC (GH1 family)
MLCMVLVSLASAQDNSIAWKRWKHLQRGVALSSWFGVAPDYSIQRLREYTVPGDLEHIHQLGFDHVRIPVDPVIFNCPGSWDTCERVQMLDQVIHKALSLDLAVILDFHPDFTYTHQLETSEASVDKYLRLWAQIADHYATTDQERLFFEVMNEYNTPDSSHWLGTLEQSISVIRRHAPNATLIVSGAGYSDIWDLVRLPVLQDTNVIYNFHYYEPHIFTHQGATWGEAWWRDLNSLPFPATPTNIADAMNKEEDEAVRWHLWQYGNGHWDSARIAADIQFAANWAKSRKVPLLCDEFGVFREASNPEDRERWLTGARTAFEANNIGWSMWNYQSDFGVVFKDNKGIRDDPSVLRALGLKQ